MGRQDDPQDTYSSKYSQFTQQEDSREEHFNTDFIFYKNMQARDNCQ